MVTLKQLRYFVALCETRHFGRAAERCAVSQPALSMQIQELESILGLVLIERRRGGVYLTKQGDEIAAMARDITTATQDLIDFARHGSKPLVGTLRLGVIPSIAPYLLPQMLPALRAQYPLLQLSLRETQTAHLIDELLDGDLDILLLALPIDHGGIKTLKAFDDTFLLAVPAKKGDTSTRVRPKDIAAADLLLLEEGHCLRDQILKYCEGLGPIATTGLGATSLTTIIEMVANGYGVTLLPEMSTPGENDDDRVRLLQFGEPVPKRTVGLAWRAGSTRSGDAAALSDLLRHVWSTMGKDHRVGTGSSPR